MPQVPLVKDGEKINSKFLVLWPSPSSKGPGLPFIPGAGVCKQAQVWKLVEWPYFPVAMIHSNFSFFSSRIFLLAQFLPKI